MPDPNVVIAYVGPGADMSLISYALTLAAVGLSAFSAIFLWPFYALMRRVRGVKAKGTSAVEVAPGEPSANNPSQP